MPRIGVARSVVQDDGEQRAVNLDTGVEIAVVLDESEPFEFLHEEIHARPRRADDFRQRLLRDFRDDLPRLDLLAVAREQKQRPRQPLLAGIEELVDQVLFDADVLDSM